MNYDQAIQEIIDVIKADKLIVQPWRNKASARLEEAQAFIDKGKRTTYREPDEAVCNCPEGGRRKNCPVHGEVSTNGRCICTELGKRKDCPVHGGQV